MNIVTAIFAALCFARLQDVSGAIKILKKSQVAVDRRLAFDRHSYVDGKLTYALCDKNFHDDQIKCTVFREKKSFGNESYSCDVILKRSANHRIPYLDYITIIPFGDNNVALSLLIAWQPYFNFTTVQLKDCRIGEATFDTVNPFFWVFSGAFVGHTNSYDIFYKGPDSTSWADETYKITIDADGKIVDGPRPSIGNVAPITKVLQPVHSLDDNSSTNRYFYIQTDEKNFTYRLVESDGKEKSLARYPPPSGSKSVIPISTNNKLIGVCYPKNDEYICSQYDFNGDLKMQTTLPRPSEETALIVLHNLPYGGFYLVSAMGDQNRFPHLLIERIDSDGSKTGSFNFQGFEIDNWSGYHGMPCFYTNESNETCLTIVTFDSDHFNGPKEGKGHLYLTANCFTDADFSK